MAIALGRSLTHPAYVLAQMVYAVSLFLLLLGCARVAVDATALVWLVMRSKDGDRGAATPQQRIGALRCFHVSVASLFTSHPSAPASSAGATTTTTTTAAPAQLPRIVVSQDGVARFLCAHMLAAGLLARPLSLLLQRRKVVLDFVATLYAVYVVLSCIVVRRVPPGKLSWLLVLLCGACTLTTSTWYLCRRRELQLVALHSDTTGMGSSTAAHAHTGAATAVATASGNGTVAAVPVMSLAAAAANNSAGGGGGGNNTAATLSSTGGAASALPSLTAATSPATAALAVGSVSGGGGGSKSSMHKALSAAPSMQRGVDAVEMEQLPVVSNVNDEGRAYMRATPPAHVTSSTTTTTTVPATTLTSSEAGGVAARGPHSVLHHVGGVAVPGYVAKRKTN